MHYTTVKGTLQELEILRPAVRLVRSSYISVCLFVLHEFLVADIQPKTNDLREVSFHPLLFTVKFVRQGNNVSHWQVV